MAARSLFGVIGVLVIIAYCGGLAYHFLDVGGSWHGAKEIGLGPTVMGLGAIGLLFCLVLLFKLIRLFRAPPSPGAGGPGVPARSLPDDDAFDADEVISRYLERRSNVAQPAAGPGAADRRPSALPAAFGRRSR